jgi:hypothetical protein
MSALNHVGAVLKLESGLFCNLQVTVGNRVPSRRKIGIVTLKDAPSIAKFLSGTDGRIAQKSVAVASRIVQGMC